jgi:hypothetical protein
LRRFRKEIFTKLSEIWHGDSGIKDPRTLDPEKTYPVTESPNLGVKKAARFLNTASDLSKPLLGCAVCKEVGGAGRGWVGFGFACTSAAHLYERSLNPISKKIIPRRAFCVIILVCGNNDDIHCHLCKYELLG